MKILIIGSGARVQELRSTIGNAHELTVAESEAIALETKAAFDAIFDTTFDNEPPFIELFEGFNGTAVVSAVNTRLVHASGTPLADCKLIGMNMLPTFINHEVKEWTFLNDKSRKAGEQLAKALGWKYLEVEDRVGMVTARILFQIINEACYTLQEGTASIEDIDNAMKLGTNYPFGPFEWADKIGLGEIVQTLSALSTEDPERYRVCPLLEEKYFRGETFYPK